MMLCLGLSLTLLLTLTADDVVQTTGQLGLGHTAEDVAAMFTAAVLASTPPGSVAVGQPADGGQTGAHPPPDSGEEPRLRVVCSAQELDKGQVCVAIGLKVKGSN
jgi:hypothetical protein